MSGPEATADLRWLRAVVVSLVALALGTVAHASAGGLMPGVGVVLVVLGFLVVLSATALGRPASYVVLAALVGGGQMLVHVVLTAVAGHAGPHAVIEASPALPLAGPAGSGSGGGALDVLAAATGTAVQPALSSGQPDWIDHLVADLTGANLLMSLAHLAAAAAVAWWLLVGERSLWTLVALLGRHVLDLPAHDGIPTAPVDDAIGRRALMPLHEPRVRSARLVADGPVGRRGPPSLLRHHFTLTA